MTQVKPVDGPSSAVTATPGGRQPRQSVQSIIRALEILEALGSAGRATGITDIAEQVSLPLPTVHRILGTLVGAGYVTQTPRRLYALGARLITLAHWAGGALGVALRPYLEKVVEATGESASIAMLDQDFARYISHVPAEYSTRMNAEVGTRVSLHATGVGKAILSALAEAEVASILARYSLRRFTPHTLTEPGKLTKELAKARQAGYVLDRQEHEIGTCCVAMPIPGPLPLAISVSGPPSRLTDQVIETVALPALHRAIEELTPVIAAAMAEG